MSTFSIITIVIAILLAIVVYAKKICYTYWKRRGIECIEPEFYYGNIRRTIRRQISFAEQFQTIYREFKHRKLRHGGFYMFFKPVYIPLDPEILKSILQKDFNHFVNHGMYVNEEADPITGNLFNLEDAKWKNIRAKLTPVFTSGKMKMMFHTLVACSDGLEELLDDHSIIQDAVDIKEVLSRFTTDVIGSCAFGLDCNSIKDPNSEFRKYGRKIFNPTFIARMKAIIVMLIPKQILKAIGFKLTRGEIESFFMNVVKTTVNYREQNKILRKDFIHMLIQLKNKGKVNDDESIADVEVDDKGQTYLSLNEITAHSVVFFVAGYETSATTMTFALYELAVNQDIQEKLRNEIRNVLQKYDDKISYEAVMEMSYLDKVIHETLRKYPPVPGTPRVCNKAYPVPGTNCVIEEGTRVHIPIYGLHTDPEYYPEPEVFDPERFSEENKAKRPPCTFIPFGDGPRICIGLRFGLMQTKVGLIKIIGNYQVTLNQKTKTPVEFDTLSVILSVKGGVWLNVSKLK